MPNPLPGCFSLFKPFQHRRSTTVSDCPTQTKRQPSKLEISSSNKEHTSDFLGDSPQVWDHDIPPPGYAAKSSASEIYKPEVLRTIESEINKLDSSLRKLSLKIHDNPEIAWEERFAHDTLTAFMSSHGFHVTRHYLGLETAWRATFSHGTGGRTIGVNAEMTALPEIGHGCGRNLIAMIGVGISLAIKAALEKHDIPGKIYLLGTPAEEGGGGKAVVQERGGFKEMDACVMAHPFTGAPHSAGTGTSYSLQKIEVEYFGVGAHAAAEPWDGKNALDAAFIAYSSISALRQQIKPAHRIHGTVFTKEQSPNIIPDYAKMQWYVRAFNKEEVVILRQRVVNCLEAAALATSTKAKIAFGDYLPGLLQNDVLAENFAEVASEYNVQVNPTVPGGRGSTQFGKISYLLPSLHPSYAIPTIPNGGNHTAYFTAAAATPEAHQASLCIVKALAHTGFRFIEDDEFFKRVESSFKNVLAEK